MDECSIHLDALLSIGLTAPVMSGNSPFRYFSDAELKRRIDALLEVLPSASEATREWIKRDAWLLQAEVQHRLSVRGDNEECA